MARQGVFSRGKNILIAESKLTAAVRAATAIAVVSRLPTTSARRSKLPQYRVKSRLPGLQEGCPSPFSSRSRVQGKYLRRACLFSANPLVLRATGGLFGYVAVRKEFSPGHQKGDLVYLNSLVVGDSGVGSEECPHFPHVLPFLLNWSD